MVALLLGLQACRPQGGRPEAPKEPPAGTHFHALPQTQLGIYAVMLPPDYDAPANRDKTYPLVLIVHGHGSTEIRHGQLADTFGRKDVIYLAPRAPYPHERVFIELDTPGWTAMPTVPEQLWEIDEDHPDYIDVDRLYTDWIFSTIQDVRRRYRVSDQRLVIYGHSQGATYAHLFALHHPELVKAYFAFAGYYEFIKDKTPGEAAETLKRNDVFPSLLHNRLDPMVDVSETTRLAAYFEQYAVGHESLLSETGDHYLTDDERTRAATFIRDWCCGAHASDKRTLPPLQPQSEPDTEVTDQAAPTASASDPP